MLDVTSRDALDHWHIDVRLGATQRRAVRLQEEAGHKERGALVAIRQRVVARQALQQDRRLLQDRWIDLHIAKAGARRRERGLSEPNVGKRAMCSGVVPRTSAATSQKSPNSG